MSKIAWIGTLSLALITASWVSAQEPACCEMHSPVLQQARPTGGWCPYGCLFHWWKPDCFPRACAPDDYCRKTLPDVCRPTYPPWYIWGPRQDCCPQGGCCQTGHAPHTTTAP